MARASRGGEHGLADLARFVCLSFGDASALPAMKVCLFSNPGLWTTGRTPERPAPSLLQGVLKHAVGRLFDRARYFPGTFPIASPFEDRGTPTGTCDFGQARYRTAGIHNQLKSRVALKKIRR